MVTIRVDTNVRAAYIQFTDEQIVETVEVNPSVLVDIDEAGVVVGVELLGFSVAIPIDVIERSFRFASPEHRQILQGLRPSTGTPLSFAGSGQANVSTLQPA